MWRCSVFAVLFACVAAVAQNLANDGGFEAPSLKASGWNADGSVWSLDELIKRNGGASIRYHNTDPSLYRLCNQRIEVKRGRAYKLSAWVQVRDIKGPEAGGATLALEWFNAKGQFLGGFYPDGFKGTNDWQRFEAVSRVAPDEVSYAMLVVYARKKTTGTAWFDEVSVQEVAPRAWKTFLVQPSYRGALASNNAVTLRIELLDWIKPTEHLVKIRVVGTKKGSEFSTDRQLSGHTSDLIFRIPESFGSGIFHLNAALVSKTGETKATFATTLTKALVSGTPTVEFSMGCAVVNGKPFMPIGVFDGPGWSADTPTRLKAIAQAGMNTVLPYGLIASGVAGIRKYLDTAHANGLKVILSVKDLYEGSRYEIKKVDAWTSPETIMFGIVKAFRNHPALLAWYVNDELGQEWQPKLERNYRWITALDPNHPCYTVSNQPGALETFANSTDVLGTDPYPVPGSPLSMVADWTKPVGVSGKPNWMVIQAFDKSNYLAGLSPAMPSFNEMRCMTYLALAHGASGIMFYSFHDLKRSPGFDKHWDQLSRIAKDIRRFREAFCAGKPVPEVKVTTSQGDIHWRAVSYKERLYVLVVNTGSASVPLDVKVPARWAAVSSELSSASLVSSEGAAGPMAAAIQPYDAKVFVFDLGSKDARSSLR